MKDKILEIIRSNPDGIESNSLESIVQDQIHINKDSCEKYLREMIADKQLEIVNYGSQYRYIAAINQNYSWPETFKIIGPPQSNAAMKTLSENIKSYTEELILVIDVTSPDVFMDLEERLRKRLKTIVLMPPKKEIEFERREFYKNIITKWKKLYQNSKPYKSLKLLVSRTINKSIRTTLFNKDFARINIRDLNLTTTRNGLIAEVNHENSLYKQYCDDINSELKKASPFFTLNPIMYIKKNILIPLLFIAIVGISWLLYNNTNPLLAMISSFFVGVVGNILYEKYNNIKRN